ncbi:MAG TPA: hypothetical protein VKB35_16030, partial [Ktedonobacteraceae bacterium]|nr:hypothetical protein [Ktedonobacteraceae bacterium]
WAGRPGGRIAKLRRGENSVTEKLLTTVVGSYPQPEWLVDRQNLQNRLPPRIRALEGIEGPTALHLCFGYAALVPTRPSQYAFLTELRECVVK